MVRVPWFCQNKERVPKKKKRKKVWSFAKKILEYIFFLSEKQKHCNIPNFVHCGQNCFIFCADVEVFLAKRPSGCWFCCAHLPPMYSAPALLLPTVQKSIVTIKALKLCYSRASESDMVQDHKHHLFDLSIGLTKVGEWSQTVACKIFSNQ